MKAELLYFDGCPHGPAARERLRTVLGRLAPGAVPELIRVETDAQVVEHGFPGSPTIRIDGRDVEGGSLAPGWSCRRYDGGGAPPVWLIEAAVLRALDPRHVLFLCVANSARSQMAEGIARSLAPEHVVVSSAGSEPKSVRPEAVAVLAEIGLDISQHRSKSVAELDETAVDAVVTLCAEEVCPVWQRPVARVDWALPDPAAVADGPEARLAAFRRTRDELRRRLERLWAV